MSPAADNRARAWRRLRNGRGIALVSVLWVLTLLALIAAAFLRTTRGEINLTYNLTENARAEALAEAGVHQAIYGLSDSDPDQAWRVDGTPYVWLYGGGEIRVAVRDEGGKVDLNRAEPTLFAALFEALGVASDEAEALSDAIADFRDPNDLRRPRGAEDPDYRREGLDWDAKDAPFTAVEELQQVIGVTPALYRAVAPYVSVHARNRRPHEATAADVVVAAMTGEVPDSTGALVPEEAGNGDGGAPATLTADSLTEEALAGDALPPGAEALGETPQALIGEAPPLRSRARVFTVHAEARTQGGAVFAREAVIQLTGGRPPYRILVWRQGERRLFPAPKVNEEVVE